MKRHIATLIAVTYVGAATSAAPAQWPGWGGKNRNFVAEAKDLAPSWPETGPKRIWTRELGAGYSAISFVDGRLYTMCRRGDDEVILALDALTGTTVWEHQYGAPIPEGVDIQFGKGPNATPLIHEGRVYTFGVGGQLHCVDQKTGAPVWSHDVLKEYSAKPPAFGFSSSPIVYKNTLVAAIGGSGSGIAAFDLKTGAPVWKKHDFENIYSSPILINVAGKDQLVLIVDREIVGLDPAAGDLLWRTPFENQWKTNITTPIWGDDGLLYVTTSGDVGTKGLKITQADGAYKVEEAWSTRKMQIGQSSAVRVGDHVYGCSGSEGPFFMMAVHAGTGKVAWRERGFGKSNVVYGDGKLIILDEDGTLALATATPEGFKVQSKTSLLKKSAWTVPTLVGQRLFVRDNEMIMALDLGAGSGNM